MPIRKKTTKRGLRGIEHLQSRKLMAADIDLVDGLLEIQGTNHNDIIEIRFDDSDNIEIEIDSFDASGDRVDGKFRQYDIEDVHAVNLHALAGNDNVRIFHEDPADQTDIDLVTQFDEFEIHGGTDNDTIGNDTEVPMRAFGGDGVDTIRGGSSRDEIFGGNDNDWLYGGDGNDLIMGEDGDDRILGNDGHDTLYGHNDNLTQSNAQADVDRIYGGLGQDTIRGGGGNDYLYGGEGSTDTHTNYMYGDDGSDRMYGGSQRDYMYGLNGTDYMYGRAGSDRLYGGNDTDYLYGQDGDDRLYGNGGFDYLIGGNHNDRLDGGLDGNADYMRGDSGADVFVRYGYSNPIYGWITSETENEVDRNSGEGDSIAHNYGFIATVGVLVRF